MRKTASILVILLMWTVTCPAGVGEYPLWELARGKRRVMTVSTLFTAQQVRDHLGTEAGIDSAIDWCKQTGVTRVFIEAFRSRYRAERATLERARDRFRKAGFEVSGCVTTTNIGKQSTGWNVITCYTDTGSQDELQKIFEYTASMFDEIMIDDFLFTDCQCEECVKARGDQSWESYRCDLMVTMSRERILGAARKVNPKVKIIIKYPQWYDNFHNRGYEVVRETADYETIWVGTETRDYDDPRWGGKVQYEAYYIMRWLGEIGGVKCGGGWFDYLGTTENTYIEQACQTVLADAKEMMLFCYGGLLRGTGPANVVKLRQELPSLFKLAELVRGRPIKGIAAPKPPNSEAHNEQYVYDFVGMLGLPLVPTSKVDTAAPAAFYPVHVLKDEGFAGKLKEMLAAKKPVLITDGLAQQLKGVDLNDESITVLKVGGSPKSLLGMTREQIGPIRDKLLEPLGVRFDAPNKVGLYLIGEDMAVVENFNDEAVDAALEIKGMKKAEAVVIIPQEGEAEMERRGDKVTLAKISKRTLVAIRYK